MVCACVRTDSNPEAPRVILPGIGPEIERWAELFAQQGEPVPVFLKRAVNAWEYVGDYRVRSVERSPAAIAPYRERVARDLSMILHLEPAGGT